MSGRQTLIVATALSLLMALPAAACLWDRDTLQAEAAGLPDIVDILLGRIDRWPTVVYERRLERVSAELIESPNILALYDDAAVACDRLGLHQEAIEWMARKRIAMDSLPDEATDFLDHEYRYLANLGTFHAHQWIDDGADQSNTANLQRARELIQSAIDLNPEAHFGRERIQLLVLDRLLNLPDDPGNQDHSLNQHGFLLADYSHGEAATFFDQSRRPLDYTIEGLTGMIVLGDAWKSVDIYASLRKALQHRHDMSLAYLAQQHVFELLDTSTGLHPSLMYPDDNAEEVRRRVGEDNDIHPEHLGDVENFWIQGRAWAKEINAQRDAYIIARIDQGAHPDLDPEFMAGFTPASSRPAYPDGIIIDDLKVVRALAWIAAGLLVIVLVGAYRSRSRISASSQTGQI